MNERLLHSSGQSIGQTLEKLAGNECAFDNPEEAQEKVLLEILKRNCNTLFAREHSLGRVNSVSTYVERVAISKYDDCRPYIEKMKAGIGNVLLAEDFPRWAQTSGTLGSPKLYPFPAEMAVHFGKTLAKIIVSCMEQETMGREVLSGKMFMVVADVVTSFVAGKPVGYISGIVSHDVQRIHGLDMFTPSCEILAMRDWEARWLEMARQAALEKVTMACSTPPILLPYLKKVADEYSSILGLPADITKIWPDFTLVTGAGVKMSPYEKQYQTLLGDDVCCREFYCATEGFFAYQKDSKEGLTPILDHNFYEFIPLDQWNEARIEQEDYRTHEFTCRTYGQVRLHEDYVLLLTTPGGLYRYVIGDIVRFVGPDRMTLVGRVGWESNVAGEKFNEMHMNLLRQSLESALGVSVTNYVAAVKEDPLQYVFALEFEGDADINETTNAVDETLRELNPIYDDLRKKNVLKRPGIVMLKPGAFERYFTWNTRKKKSLGQVKPPVFASPELIDELVK